MKHILIILGIVALISCQSTQPKEEKAISSTQEITVEKTEVKEIAKTIEKPKFDEIGFASWYGIQFQGKPTASGEVFDRFKLTAAHRTIPFGSVVKVQNLENNKEADVTINDRGPFDEGSIIEVTERTAEILNFKEEAVAKVGINIIKPVDENLILVKDDSFSVDDDDDDDDDDDIDEETAPPAKKGDNKKPATVTPAAPEKKAPAPAPAPAPAKAAPANNSKTAPAEIPTTTIPPSVAPSTNNSGQPKGETVQIGVFKEQRRAEAFRDQIKKDFSEKIFLFSRSGTYVVQIGDFAKREDAVALRERLKAKKINNCFIPPKN